MAVSWDATTVGSRVALMAVKMDERMADQMAEQMGVNLAEQTVATKAVS